MQNLPPHPRYDVQQDLATADAVAYAFLSKEGAPVQYPFKFRDLPDNEVRIRITYTGLCQSDCLHTRGRWDPSIEHPDCPGHEVLGIVEKLGKACNRLKVGDRVGVNPQRASCGECEHCKNRNENLCLRFGGLYDERFFGGYSTHIQLTEKHVFLLPEGFNEELGSPLLCAGVTMFAPLKRFARPTQTCAVIGIGGLGHLAVMYANKMGLVVTAFTTSMHKEADIKAMGATRISHSLNVESLAQEKGKFDIVLNTLFVEDEEIFKSHQRLTAVNGTYVQLGAPPSEVNFKLDYAYIILNQVRVSGSIIGSCQETEEMLQFSAIHNVYPIVESFEFEQFPQAFARLESGKAQYRCVVNCGKWAQEHGFWK